VIVQHDQRSAAPLSKINIPISLRGTFWHLPGKTHTAQWPFDNGGSAPGVVTEQPRRATEPHLHSKTG
jgi:hypothetical protein